MSASFHKKTKSFDPLGHAAVEGIFDIEGQEKKQAAAEQAAKDEAARRAAEESAAAERLQTRQVATRGQELRAAASAAGATRTENQYDWLAGGKPRAKRRDASKTLLGE